MKTRVLGLALFGFALLACGENEGLAGDDPGPSSGGSAGAAGSGGSAGAAGMAGVGGNAEFQVRQSVEQLHITHAEPGTELLLYDSSASEVARGSADDLGSLVFRLVTPGEGYVIRTSGVDPEQYTGPLRVMSVENSQPSTDLYTSQTLEAGNGYITTRDGTKLSVFVTLPGPPEDGPYPTVVNYSGYDPSRPGEPVPGTMVLCGTLPVLCEAPADPSALIAALMGYATVGVNMRGTGCSGGAYDFFEPLQLLDGYDVIETVAAQSWVKGHRVGMTGLSYPGISQMFVAEARPPSLAAITPLSVIGNTFTTLVPGGILNDGFALSWATSVGDKAGPYKQGWEQGRVDAGDSVCEENQLLHGQKVDVIQKALDNPYYSAEVGDPVNPTLFVKDIDIPVFLASAFQDEQTGPFFFTLLDKFKGTQNARFNVYNGVHVDGFAPQILVEWKTFLDFYVAQTVPVLPQVVKDLGPLLFEQIFGAQIDLPANRYEGYTDYNTALSAYEAEDRWRVIFESGGTADAGVPIGTTEHIFDTWPPKETTAERWYFQPNGSMKNTPPTPANSASSFELDPDAGQKGILNPGAGIWDTLPDYNWPQPQAGKAIVFTSAPLTQDEVMVGSASVDLFLKSSVDDADLQVSLTEVRPDGQEMYVQSGWLRASQAKLSADASDLWPSHTHLESDVSLLTPDTWVNVRVGIPGFAHVFRTGSRISIVIDTPGQSRAEWRFALKTFAGPAVHSIGHSSSRPSSVLLPVIGGMAASTPLPACPSLRGQPCRTYMPFSNTAAP